METAMSENDENVLVLLRVARVLGNLQDYTRDSMVNESLQQQRVDLLEVCQKMVKI